eukprot:g47219.t1
MVRTGEIPGQSHDGRKVRASAIFLSVTSDHIWKIGCYHSNSDLVICDHKDFAACHLLPINSKTGPSYSIPWEDGWDPKHIEGKMATVEENTCNTVNVEKWEDSNVTKRRGKEKLPNGNQNESVHLQIFTASEKEQPSMEPSPHLEKSQSTEGSDFKRRQRKRHAEFEDSAEKDEIAGNAADDSAPVNQSTRHLSNERATGASKGTTAQSKTDKIPRLIRATGKLGLKSPAAVGKTGLNHVTPGKKIIVYCMKSMMDLIMELLDADIEFEEFPRQKDKGAIGYGNLVVTLDSKMSKKLIFV